MPMRSLKHPTGCRLVLPIVPILPPFQHGDRDVRWPDNPVSEVSAEKRDARAPLQRRPGKPGIASTVSAEIETCRSLLQQREGRKRTFTLNSTLRELPDLSLISTLLTIFIKPSIHMNKSFWIVFRRYSSRRPPMPTALSNLEEI